MSNNLFQFINIYKVTGDSAHTHVSMGYPYGKFNIPQDKINEFHCIYSQYVNKINLHIAEKQLDMAQLILDIDILQNTSIRQYTFDDIKEIVLMINDIIKQTHNIDNQLLKSFIMEKPIPVQAGVYYKDGIHIMYPDVILSKIDRKIIIEKITDMSKNKHLFGNYNFVNNLDDTFDKAIVSVPWLMYGSQKKNGNVYKLSCVFSNDLGQIDHTTYSTKQLVDILSIHKENNNIKNQQNQQNIAAKYIPIENNNEYDNNYNIYIAKKLVNMLPIKYSTNYYEWLQICWILKNIDETLFSTFINFSEKDIVKYNYHKCRQVWNLYSSNKGLTIATLHYYAKKENPIKYNKFISKYYKSKNDDIMENDNIKNDNIIKNDIMENDIIEIFI